MSYTYQYNDLNPSAGGVGGLVMVIHPDDTVLYPAYGGNAAYEGAQDDYCKWETCAK